MAKDNELINQHKRLAMGQKVTGMKKGGKVDKPSKTSSAKPVKKSSKGK